MPFLFKKKHAKELEKAMPFINEMYGDGDEKLSKIP